MTPLLLLVAVPFLLLSPQGRDAGAAVRDFEKAFKSTPKRTRTVEERSAALELLGEHDSRAVAEALANANLGVMLELALVDAERIAANQEMAKLLRGKEFDEQRQLPKADYDRYHELKDQVGKLRDRGDGLRQLDIDVRKRLAALEDPESLKWLLRKVVGSKKYPMPLQLTAGRTAGGAGDAVLEDLAQTLRRARKPETIVVLLDGIGLCAVSARGYEDIVLPLLRHKEGAVRERAALALSKIAVVEAIEPMIQLMSREQGQARKRIVAALEVLTRKEFGDNIGAWQAWWREEGATYVAGERRLGGGQTSGHRKTATENYYFGIPQDGQSILYVIDSSGSMKKKVDFNLGETTAGGRSTTRLEACKAELIRALGRLRKDQKFNVIWYNDLAHLYEPAMLAASADAVASAQAWVRKLRPASSTNIHDALEMGFGLTGRGRHDKYYGIEVDTIFLLTDGSPTKPDGTLDSTEKILVAVRDWNALKRVVIHCIGIGKGLNQSFLAQLARENGGDFKKF